MAGTKRIVTATSSEVDFARSSPLSKSAKAHSFQVSTEISQKMKSNGNVGVDLLNGVKTIKEEYIKQGDRYVKVLADRTNFDNSGPKVVKMKMSFLTSKSGSSETQKANALAMKQLAS